MPKWKILVPSFIVLIFLSLILVPWNNLVQDIAIEQLNKQGFGPASLKISSIGLTGTVIDDVSVLSGGVKVKHLEVDWTVSGLLGKQISDVRIDGVSFDPKSFQERDDKKTEKSSDIIDFDQILKKIPTDNISLGMNIPDSLSGFNFSNAVINLVFDKSQKSVVIELKEVLKISNEKIEVTVKPFRLLSLIESRKIIIRPEGLKADFIYHLDKKNHSFVRLDEIVLDNKSSIELVSSEKGITPGRLGLNFVQARGAFGEKNTNWGTINLSVVGIVDDLSISGEVKNINHVESECLNGLDLDLEIKKKDEVSFSIKTPKKRKDFEFEVSGKTEGKVRFEVISKDLSKVDFKKTFPCVGKDISNVKGELGLFGFMNLGQKKSERVDLKINDASFQWDEMKVKGIDLESNVISFKNFQSATPTKINIKKVGLAFELEGIAAELSIGKALVNVDRFGLKLLGGRLWTDAFVFHRKDSTTENMVIKVDDLPLNDVLKIGLKDAVNATGSLQGQLPIVWSDKIPLVKKGLLETKGTGLLQYAPKAINPLEKTGNPNVNMLSNYLKNLNYSKLSIDVDSDEKYNLQMKANIFGKNPTVNNGRPLKFGFNLGLDIKNAIISYLTLMKIPEKMEKNFLKKLQK